MLKNKITSLFPYLFFGLLAWSLLAPLSSDFLPEAPDLPIHISGVVEASAALKQGQFPIRTTPRQINGWNYPFFQFYSPLPYSLAGAVTLILNSHSPKHAYTALKFILWLAIFLGGIYSSRISFLITKSKAVSLLAGFAFMSAPYLLVNFTARGDFTEVFAQGMVPIVFYYTFINYIETANIKGFICNTLAWFVLITSHNITFIYTSFFIGLFFIIMTILHYKSWRKLIYLGLPYFGACVLAAWFLVPILLFSKILYVQNDLIDPYTFSWLTPLSNLLAVSAISPMPLPGRGLPSFLYPEVGWPILLSAGTVFYFLWMKNFGESPKKELIIAKTTLILFLLAFVMMWIPFDFFQYLPRFFWITQFGYRILTQTMWLGVILFSIAFLWIYREKFSPEYFIIFLFILGLCASSWLPTLKGTALSLDSITTSPNLGYGNGCFLVDPKKIQSQVLTNINLTNLIPIMQAQKNCSNLGKKTVCIFQNTSKEKWVQLPIFFYPEMTVVTLNGKDISYYPTLYKQGNLLPHLLGGDITMATVALKPGKNVIEFYFRGIIWANWLTLSACFFILFLITYSLIKSRKLKRTLKHDIVIV